MTGGYERAGAASARDAASGAGIKVISVAERRSILQLPVAFFRDAQATPGTA
jgi:hypothetical protein